MLSDRFDWPNRVRWFDLVWVLFSIANLVAIYLFSKWETVPFHLIWVSLTILYGFRVWRARPTLSVLAGVMVATTLLIWLDIARNAQRVDELTEVPLMAAMFLAMVWHARRRLTAMELTERVSMENLRLLEREHRFVQDASHELRTPITVALGHAELIQRTSSDPTAAADAAVIADELLRLRRLADRLLLLAGTGDPEFLHLEAVDLETIVVAAVRRWAVTPRCWRLGGGEETIVMADVDRLDVVLDALIENAVDHTQEQDTVEVALGRQGSLAAVTVRDTGAGIPSADLEHIFDRFARADRGRSRHTGGFGLGLSIVREIVEAHGGEVRVTSAVGVGTTFEIRLPLAPVVPSVTTRSPAQVEVDLAAAHSVGHVRMDVHDLAIDRAIASRDAPAAGGAS